MQANPSSSRGVRLFIGATVLVAVLALPIAGAAQAGVGFGFETDGLIAQGEVVDNDLFISGETVQVDGDVIGDVFATGESVVINGNVAGNVFMAGQNLELNGNIEGSVYGAGYSLNLGPNAGVLGNVYSAGFSFATTSGSVVGRNVYSVGYQGIIDGNVGRDLLFSGAAFRLNGNVGRDLTVEISKSDGDQNAPEFYMPGDVVIIEPGYEVSDSATVGGETNYTVSEYQADQSPPSSDTVFGVLVADAIRTRIGEFVALLIVGVVLLTVWPTQLMRVERQIQQRPLESLGWGLALVILFPVVMIIAIVLLIMLAVLLGFITLGELVSTVLGFGAVGIGLLAVVFGFVLWIASKAIFGHFVGEAIFARLNPSTLDSRWGAVLALAVGVLIYELLRIIPIVGAIVAFFVVLIGLGGVAVTWRNRKLTTTEKRKTRRPRK